VLCYLEGLTQEAAARQLRVKAGVLRGRLDRARLRLRGRLARRGFVPAATLALTELLEVPAQAAVPAALMDGDAGGRRTRPDGRPRWAGTVVASTAVRLATDVLRRHYLGQAALFAALLVAGTLTLAGLSRPRDPGTIDDPTSVSAGARAGSPPRSRTGSHPPVG